MAAHRSSRAGYTGTQARRRWRNAMHAVLAAVLLLPTFNMHAAPLAPDRYPPAVASLHRSAVAGDADARYDLAIVLLCGAQVPRDAASAALWLALLAPAEHSGAQSVLGWQLMTGTGVLRDDRHAAYWLRAASDHGDTAANNNLGVVLALGRGVPRDLAAAERRFRAAAEMGAEAAAHNLAVLLGRDVPHPTAGQGRQHVATHPALTAVACRAMSVKKSR